MCDNPAHVSHGSSLVDKRIPYYIALLLFYLPSGSSREREGWAELPADELDAHGVEWLRYSDRAGARSMSLPRSLAHVKREISEKKWLEARRWVGGRVSIRLSSGQSRQWPVNSATRVASRFYVQAEDGSLPNRPVVEVASGGRTGCM